MRPARLGLILLVALAGCDDMIDHAAVTRGMTCDVDASSQRRPPRPTRDR